MTSSTQQTTLDPDERCGVCEIARAEHGDMQHEFNLEGDLIPKKPSPPPRNTPPELRDNSPVMSPKAKKLAEDPSTQVMLRLIERLTARGLLQGEDLQYIFGG